MEILEYVHSYFMVIWYILEGLGMENVGTFFGHLVCGTKNNLATLVETRRLPSTII
jgi:hypothetical protein